MAVPKKKTTRSKVGMRRSHDSIQPIGVIFCKNCGEARMPHNICKHCNTYNDRNVRPTPTINTVNNAEA
jgi:large subunit ribosomal protein L32